MFCVGATKAGTTWLHDQLSAHPECHLRTIKEFHYFSTNNDAQWAKMLGDTRDEITRLGKEPIFDPASFAARRLADLRGWAEVLAARAVNIELYRAFMLDGLGARKLVGDFTPAYSVIRGKTLERMLELGRDVRVVYLIRDPLARLWSHIRMSAERAAPQDFAQTATDLLRRTLLGEVEGGIQGMLRRGDYAGNLPKLQRVFGAARLLVMFTEDLMTAAGYARLLAFLGLSPRAAELGKPVHLGRPLMIPDTLRAAACRFLRPQYDYIASEFSTLPEVWRRNMNEGLASGRDSNMIQGRAQ